MNRKFLFVILISIGAFANSLMDKAKEAYDSGNLIKTSKLYKEACDAGDTKGCLIIGLLYEGGMGVRQNYFKASKFYQKACDSGNAQGCYNLGVLYNHGQGVKQNYFKAKELFGNACDIGNENGCKGYARLNKQINTIN